MTDSGGENMLVRRAAPEDLDAIMAIYDSGRAFMRAQGNYVQWVNGYPSRDLLAEDIRKGQCYVCEADGELAGVFAFILGEDPTYQKIEEGSWRSASPYGTVHRLASSGKYRGVGKACYDFCKGRIGHGRADTIKDSLYYGVLHQVLKNRGNDQNDEDAGRRRPGRRPSCAGPSGGRTAPPARRRPGPPGRPGPRRSGTGR